jgi:NarL family two-component system response regulator LiaR
VLIVDDQPVIRRGLRMWLDLETDLAVVGEAATGEEALQIARCLQPDVVLIAVELPGMDGVAATAAIRAALPATQVIVLSLYADAPTRARALAAGAAAFIAKGSGDLELLASLRALR